MFTFNTIFVIKPLKKYIKNNKLFYLIIIYEVKWSTKFLQEMIIMVRTFFRVKNKNKKIF